MKPPYQYDIVISTCPIVSLQYKFIINIGPHVSICLLSSLLYLRPPRLRHLHACWPARLRAYSASCSHWLLSARSSSMDRRPLDPPMPSRRGAGEGGRGRWGSREESGGRLGFEKTGGGYWRSVSCVFFCKDGSIIEFLLLCVEINISLRSYVKNVWTWVMYCLYEMV